MKVNRISIIEPWAAVTSGGRVTVLLSRVACIAGGVILLLSLFSPTQHPALFTDALVQLSGSAFPHLENRLDHEAAHWVPVRAQGDNRGS